MLLRTLTALGSALAIQAAATAAEGAAPGNYPSRPIHFISCCTGFPEATARILAEEIGRHVEQPVVVEPKPGANGIIAADYVAKAAPDGYTVLIGTNSTHAANQSLFKTLPYDFVKDFTPVSGISRGALMAAVRKETPVHSVAELTAAARERPGKLTYGWGSSSTRAAMELYKLIADIDILDVPYKTNPQASVDLLAGQIDMVMGDMVLLGPLVESGRLRPLAVSTATRVPAFPDVPTMREAGVPDYELTFWLAAYAPAGTPAPVAERLNELFVDALNSERVREFLVKAGSQPFPTSSAELMTFQVAEREKWHKITAAAGIQPE